MCSQDRFDNLSNNNEEDENDNDSMHGAPSSHSQPSLTDNGNNENENESTVKDAQLSQAGQTENNASNMRKPLLSSYLPSYGLNTTNTARQSTKCCILL